MIERATDEARRASSMVCQHGNTLTLAALMPGSARTGAESEPHQFPSIRLAPLVTAGLERPLFLTHAGDRSGCLFVMEQSGTIRIIDQGVLRKVPFLDMRDRVATDGPERGSWGWHFILTTASTGAYLSSGIRRRRERGCTDGVAQGGVSDCLVWARRRRRALCGGSRRRHVSAGLSSMGSYSFPASQ